MGAQGYGLMTPGTRVACDYRGSHVGTLLAVDDLRAWHGWTAAQVAEHLEWCALHGVRIGENSLPVLWDFGRVMWDRSDALAPVLSVARDAA